MTFYSKYIKFILTVVFSALIVGSCSDSPTDSKENGNELFESEDVCDLIPDFSIFRVDNAANTPVLGPNYEVSTLGLSGAQNLANDLSSIENSFCSYSVPDDIITILEDIVSKYESGNENEAYTLIEELINDIENGQYAFGKLSPNQKPAILKDSDQTRTKVRTLLTVAGQAQVIGYTEAADNAWESAQDSYSDWASGEINNADLYDLLEMAGESQLLGLEELEGDAWTEAVDRADSIFKEAYKNFSVCYSSEDDLLNLLEAGSIAEILGIEVINEYQLISLTEEWSDIQKRRANGDPIPECDAWQVNLSIETYWDNSWHKIYWEGQFVILEDNILDGQGTGTFDTHLEYDCTDFSNTWTATTDVTGDFTFEIEGKKDIKNQVEIFAFLFPGEINTINGTSTCNPFERSEYGFVEETIKAIHVYGYEDEYYTQDGDEFNIYMVLPAEDGATKSYETLIGIVTVSISIIETQ